ncbi:MAG: TIR domain-containing protein [Pseudomonadota bacterium]
MHDIFLSYAREDEAWVERFCDLLKSQGISVWKDSSIPSGKSFGRVIEEAIASARAVVVVWSHYSVESDWVRAEATEGLRRGILMPVLRDNAVPPLRFRTIQTIELSDWKFETDHAKFMRLVKEIKGLPESPPIAAGDTKQTAASTPGGIKQRSYLLTAAGILLAIGLVGAIWYWYAGSQRHQLSVDLTAASIAALDELENRRQASHLYWGYFLNKEGGQSLLEQSILLALEAVRSDPTQQANEALQRGLVLLQRPLKDYKITRSANTATISSDGTRLAWSDRKSIHVLHTEGEEVTKLESDAQVAGLAFLADPDYLLAVERKGNLSIWKLSTGRKLSTILGKEANVVGFALDASGSRVAVRQVGLVTVWELGGGRQIAAIETDSYLNLSVDQSLDLSPDGRYLAFAPKDQVRIWDLEQMQELQPINFDDRVASLLFDPTGKMLATFSEGGEARFLTLAYGDEKGHTLAGATRLSRFAPGLTHLARTSAGRALVSSWDTPGKMILESKHGDNIKDVRFSQDGRLLATAGQDGMVRAWDLAAARELMRFSHQDKVLAVQFSTDATTLTTISGDGRIGIWPVIYTNPVVEACRRLNRNLTPDEWQRHLPGQAYRETCPAVRP